MKRVVSFSLWGNSEIYLSGALKSARQVSEFYPGWECWFYLGRDVPQDTRTQLEANGARVLEAPDWGPWGGMYWRFLAASDPDVEIMISRDADSTILKREVAAVNEWLESGKALHIMRDHPKHEVPIMGGMWGCRTSAFRDMHHLILKWNRFDRYGCDQKFLAQVIYPKFRNDAWIHTECIHFKNEVIRSYPLPREDNIFIGMALRDESLIRMQRQQMQEWIDSGCPMLMRPHPWSFAGRIRILTGGLWPGESLAKGNDATS